MRCGSASITLSALGLILFLTLPTNAAPCPCVDARFRISDQWPTGYCVYVELKNPCRETLRNLGFQFRTSAQFRNSWVGTYSQVGDLVTVTLPAFAATLDPGETYTESGFCADGPLPTDLTVMSGGEPIAPCTGCVIDTMVAGAAGDVNGDKYLEPCEGCLIGSIRCGESLTGTLDERSCRFTDDAETPAIEVYQFTLAQDSPGVHIVLASTDAPFDTQVILFNVEGAEIYRNDDCEEGQLHSCLKDLPLAAGTYFIGVTSPYSLTFGNYELIVECDAPVPKELFYRGEVNADGKVNIADTIATLGYLFSSKPAPVCLDAADANDDGKVNIADAVKILAHLFSFIGPLPAPFEACGTDPTADDLDCSSFPACEGLW